MNNLNKILSLLILFLLISINHSYPEESEEDAEPKTRNVTIHEKEVITEDKESLGTINKVLVDMENGDIRYMIISVGGFLGLGDSLHPVPWEKIAYFPAEELFIISYTRDQLEEAPTFEKDQWNSELAWEKEIDEFYDLPGDFVDDPQDQFITLAEREISTSDNERIGQVKNILANLENGKVDYVLVSTGGFLGLGESLTPIPIKKLSFDNIDQALSIDYESNDFNNAPIYEADDWENDNGDLNWEKEVLKFYDLEEKDSDKTKEPSGDDESKDDQTNNEESNDDTDGKKDNSEASNE